MKKESPPGLNHRIAERVRELRTTQALSLDALSSKSGVSRSMISVIERGEISATAVVLEKIAAGLGVTLASLFDASSGMKNSSSGPIAHREDQPHWKDPASGYVRRNVSPSNGQQPMQIVEVNFPPGELVAFDSVTRDQRIYQQIWILKGAMNITVGKLCHQLREGDCLAMELDNSTMFHNPMTKPARYAVVTASGPLRKRR